MSCGHHHETHCQEVLLRVYEYLDGEMTSSDNERIRIHLAECSPCLREYGIEEEVKLLVKRSHPCDTPPVQLRDRVMFALTQTTAMPGSPGGPGLTPMSFGGPVSDGSGGLPGFGS